MGLLLAESPMDAIVTVTRPSVNYCSLVNYLLLAEDLAQKGYGDTAQQVLVTAQVLVQQEHQLSAEDFKAFRAGTTWHPKVFSKLLSIGRDQRLVEVAERLPASYSSIYPLTTLSDAELKAAVSEGIVRPDAFSREILDWIKVKRLEGMDLPESITLSATGRAALTQEGKAALIAALKQAAEPFGISIEEGTTDRGTRRAAKASRELRSDDLLQRLSNDLKQVILDAPGVLLKEFEVSDAASLADGEIRVLTGVLVRLCGGSAGMWETYGKQYCLKVALEFNKTESRAQRFNYRKRLLEVKEKHKDLSDFVNYLLDQYLA